MSHLYILILAYCVLATLQTEQAIVEYYVTYVMCILLTS